MSVTSIKERIKELENQLSGTKYNKRTEHHFAIVKAQIAKLKEKLEVRTSKKGSSGSGFAVRKSGDATVVFVGFPSVGKSTLLNKLTKADSRVGAYAFTTLDVKPGMLHHKHAKIQILDVPGIISGAAEGKGRGREVLSAVRSCDLVILLIEATHPEHTEALKRELQTANIRANQLPPHVRIIRGKSKGINLSTTCKLTKVKKETLKVVLEQMRFMDTDVVIREDITLDQFMDVIEGNKVYIPMITVISKIDLVSEEQRKKLVETLKPQAIVSAHTGEGLEKMKDAVYDGLRLIRIYLKEVNKEPDMKEPMITRSGTTIGDVCRKIHRDFLTKFRFAKIWGPSAKFPGQEFRKTDKELHDQDIIELHIA